MTSPEEFIAYVNRALTSGSWVGEKKWADKLRKMREYAENAGMVTPAMIAASANIIGTHHARLSQKPFISVAMPPMQQPRAEVVYLSQQEIAQRTGKTPSAVRAFVVKYGNALGRKKVGREYHLPATVLTNPVFTGWVAAMRQERCDAGLPRGQYRVTGNAAAPASAEAPRSWLRRMVERWL